MKNRLIEKIKDSLLENISYKRYIHTMGVADASVYLAKKYNENVFDAQVAALLHDYAKDFDRDSLLQYTHVFNIPADHIMFTAHELLHGAVASRIAEKKFNIDNENILNAIENHTTGRKNMSKLEKIIYLADFIEPGRNYPGVEELRLIAEKDLDKAVFKALNNTIMYVLSIGKLLHPNTIFARNEILIKNQK